MRLLLSIGFLVLCGLLGFFALRGSVGMEALAILSGAQSECLRAIEVAHPHAVRDRFVIERTDLTGDTIADYVVEMVSDSTCGTAGCLFELCIKNDLGEVTHVPFGYAARSIRPLDTISAGMRDIEVNSDGTIRLSWNGSRYDLVQ